MFKGSSFPSPSKPPDSLLPAEFQAAYDGSHACDGDDQQRDNKHSTSCCQVHDFVALAARTGGGGCEGVWVGVELCDQLLVWWDSGSPG